MLSLSSFKSFQTNSGIMNPDLPEQVILDPKLIARGYMRSWFILDLISSIPLDYLFLIFNQDFSDNYQILHAGRALRILRFAKLLSLLRLLRLSRLVRYVSQWEEVYVSTVFGLVHIGHGMTLPDPCMHPAPLAWPSPLICPLTTLPPEQKAMVLLI